MPDDDTMLGQNTVDFRNEGRRPQTDQLFTVPPKLTERQAFIYEVAKTGPLSATQAGVLLHLKHKRQCGCGPDRECEWAALNGREVLEALKRKGLLKRDRHHIYRLADSTGSIAAGGYDPATAAFPEGF